MTILQIELFGFAFIFSKYLSEPRTRYNVHPYTDLFCVYYEGKYVALYLRKK